MSDSTTEYLRDARDRLQEELTKTKVELAIAKESLKRMAGEMRSMQQAYERRLAELNKSP